MKNKLSLYVSSIMAILAIIFYFLSFPSIDSIKKQTEKNLHELEQEANLQLDSIHQHLHHSSKKTFVDYLAKNHSSAFFEKGIAFFIYENDSLQFWTDNHPALENYMLNICLEKRLVKLRNGYYEVIRHPKNAFSPFQLYALVLIKNNFSYENKYLKNEFNKELHIPDAVIFNENDQDKNHSTLITNFQGIPIFSLDVQGQSRNSLPSLFSMLSLCVSIFSILFFYKRRMIKNQSLSSLFKWIGYVLFAILFLWVCIFKLKVLYIPLSFSYDIQNFYNLIFIFLTALLSAWVFKLLSEESFLLIKSRNNLFSFSVFIVFVYLSGYGLNVFLRTIFDKSYLSSDLADVIFSSSLEIYLSYACVFLVLFCFVIFYEVAIKQLNIAYQKNKIIVFSTITIATILLHHWLGQYDTLTAAWPGLLLLLIVISKTLCANNRFLYGTLICLFISFFVAYLSIDQKNKSDYAQRLDIAEDLADPKDEIAEHLFQLMEPKIVKDKELTHTVFKKDKTPIDIEQHLLKNYFTGYWEKYHISVCLFDSLCFPLVQHAQNLYNNNTYFDELISSKLQLTNCPNLYFNEQLKDKTFYLFKTSLPSSLPPSSKLYHKPYQLYVVIESKKTHTYRSFPDLLLIHSSHPVNTEYSYAIYKSGQLHTQQGRCEYPSVFTFRDNPLTIYDFQQNGYSHLIRKADVDTRIVVSKNYNYLSDLFSTIGFIFFASSTVFLLFSFYNSFRLNYENSLSIKIQHYSSVAIFALFIPVAYSTITLVKNQINEENTHTIKDKIETVSNYLGLRLADYDSLSHFQKDYVSYLLAQTANLFKNDITLFHSNGEYYTSSLPKLFDEGLVSKKLNPIVYTNILNMGEENEEVLNENIGNLDYYSSYKLIKNNAGKSLCVVNLPYFSKQSELQSQLFEYLSALLNIYILAFMIVSVGTALMANWLTQPLRQLQNQFKQIGLNRKDHSIKYDKNDEIGLLISAYNAMLIQLQHSAEMLAKSEREGAWKEMARQVAHEIKNPLTPMKLSIQHVERLMVINPKEATEQIRKITPVLLEQIDALSHIATEFSNFWKLPPPHLEEIELNAFIKAVLPLYANQSTICVEFVATKEPAFVKADKDQLLRVFNNLINNAVQAIQANIVQFEDLKMSQFENEKKENKEEHQIFKSSNHQISIAICKQDTHYTVSVADNGIGIDDAVKQKIFQPNFSTKSYGTGLGLAICKRMIEQHGGTIWFESQPEKGCTFYFTIPF
ncbi:MAG: sensor histidine kinase [Bacteroidia bacterium]